MVYSMVVHDNSFNLATSVGMHMNYKYNLMFKMATSRFFREGSASLMLSSLKKDSQEYYNMSAGISYQ